MNHCLAKPVTEEFVYLLYHMMSKHEGSLHCDYNYVVHNVAFAYLILQYHIIK